MGARFFEVWFRSEGVYHLSKGGSLKFGTVLIITKGGRHHGKWNREVV